MSAATSKASLFGVGVRVGGAVFCRRRLLAEEEIDGRLEAEEAALFPWLLSVEADAGAADLARPPKDWEEGAAELRGREGEGVPGSDSRGQQLR